MEVDEMPAQVEASEVAVVADAALGKLLFVVDLPLAERRGRSVVAVLKRRQHLAVVEPVVEEQRHLESIL
jgi:hypothetical protein